MSLGTSSPPQPLQRVLGVGPLPKAGQGKCELCWKCVGGEIKPGKGFFSPLPPSPLPLHFAHSLMTLSWQENWSGKSWWLMPALLKQAGRKHTHNICRSFGFFDGLDPTQRRGAEPEFTSNPMGMKSLDHLEVRWGKAVGQDLAPIASSLAKVHRMGLGWKGQWL